MKAKSNTKITHSNKKNRKNKDGPVSLAQTNSKGQADYQFFGQVYPGVMDPQQAAAYQQYYAQQQQ